MCFVGLGGKKVVSLEGSKSSMLKSEMANLMMVDLAVSVRWVCEIGSSRILF